MHTAIILSLPHDGTLAVGKSDFSSTQPRHAAIYSLIATVSKKKIYTKNIWVVVSTYGHCAHCVLK